MIEELRIEVLGGLRITQGDMSVGGFVSSKAPALLAYLAVTGRPHFRAALAGLLWSELGEGAARMNLRHVLSNLRQHLAPHLVITRDTVAFDRTSPYWLDLEQFERAFQNGDGRDIEQLRTLVALYRGNFLEGFYVQDAPMFDEWATAQRERLRQMALHALHSLTSYHLERHEYAAGIDAGARLLQLDPWREDAHRQLMLLLALSGQQSAALAQYDACRRILLDELGVEPDVETTALYERIRSGWTGLPARTRERNGVAEQIEVEQPHQTTHQHLPTYYTSFVGREAELAQITTRLTDPTCRLVTLVGPGGIGKTRLAVRAVSSLLNTFPDGVFFVSLAVVSGTEHIVQTITTALGLVGGGQDDPKVQLLRHLREKTLLLVLDNVEHLLAGADLLLDILSTAPAVKILVTSRERLAVQAEHLLYVQGLSYPEHANDGDAADYDAVRLFVERARQVRADWALREENKATIVHICQLVEGMPLAVELAATWVRTHSCKEIAQEIATSLDFLATSLRDMSERHRSLRVVFDHSWNLLVAHERTMLQQLAVFRGGFRKDGAQAVAGAARSNLVGLVDKSLLRRSPAGRYWMHPLMRQYAEERLAARPMEEVAAREQHCTFFATFLETHERALKGEGQHAALDSIEGEIHNVRLAWHWAVAHSRVTEIGRMLESLCLFYELRSWLQEGDTVTAQTVERLTGSSPFRDGEAAVVFARLLAWRARFCHVLGHYDESEHLVAQSHALAHTYDATHVLAFCRYVEGSNASVRGDYDTARSLFAKSLALYREVGDEFGAAELLNYLGGVAYDQGDFGETQRRWQEACHACRVIGDRSGLARLLNNLGEVSRFLGEYAEARKQSEESLALLRDIGYGWQLASALYNLGAVAQCEGRYAEARQLLGESLQIARQVGRARSVGLALLDLAMVALCEGALDEAQTLADEARTLYTGIGHRRGITYSLTMLASLSSQHGDHDLARRLAEESLQIAQAIGDKMAIGVTLRSLGRAQRYLRAYADAERTFAAALRIFVDIATYPEALAVILEQAELILHVGPAGGSPHVEVTLSSKQHASELLAFVVNHPAAWHSTRIRAEQLQADLNRRLPPPIRAAALARGCALAFAALVRPEADRSD